MFWSLDFPQFYKSAHFILKVQNWPRYKDFNVEFFDILKIVANIFNKSL